MNSIMSEDLTLHVNGETRRFSAPLTLCELLARMQLGEKRVAVELNREIVPRSLHATTLLSDGDRIEIVQAIGGG